MELSLLLETVMLICFGISWPVSIHKSITSKTSKGKSIFFLGMLILGYICGVASKLASGHVSYVVIFYVLNIIMVSIDIFLFFRNKKYDKMREQGQQV